MQQTNHYQLNLIERGDVFSPDALNANAEKLEAALDAARADAAAGTAAEAQARASGDAALDQRVTVLELHRIAAGTYIGTGAKSGDTQFIELGFTPVAVITGTLNSNHHKSSISVADYPLNVLEIVPGGFQVKRLSNEYNEGDTANTLNVKYRYVALC